MPRSIRFTVLMMMMMSLLANYITSQCQRECSSALSSSFAAVCLHLNFFRNLVILLGLFSSIIPASETYSFSSLLSSSP